MDERTTAAFFKLKGILGRKDTDETLEAKSSISVLKGNFDPEAVRELDLVAYHLDRREYDKDEEAFLNFGQSR